MTGPRMAMSADFLAAFAKLPSQQQRSVRAMIARFERDSRASGLNYEKIAGAKDPNMRSLRIDGSYRAVVLKPAEGDVHLLLWADRHDDAYRWAERHSCRIHPETGALQVYQPRPVADEAIARILSVTARHPYYVNALCARLWGGGQPPAAEAVNAVWSGIVAEDKRVVAGRLVRLTPSQRAVLKAIAKTEGGVEHPTSLEFLSPIRLPTSTGNRAKEVLEREDLIRRGSDGRWVLQDPVMTSYLRTL